MCGPAQYDLSTLAGLLTARAPSAQYERMPNPSPLNFPLSLPCAAPPPVLPLHRRRRRCPPPSSTALGGSSSPLPPRPPLHRLAPAYHPRPPALRRRRAPTRYALLFSSLLIYLYLDDPISSYNILTFACRVVLFGLSEQASMSHSQL